ncbi:uncharacterized protein LOC120187277 [Hibiscus syriacus]|uniref:uncharacterized protein LOC120187277 n=1 Tax=Hibiscus syriacus TaxID=106335 RepID=UPI001924B03E|nr:uncharacterized protein LOC120187277 [Hibiscus syriacus]
MFEERSHGSCLDRSVQENIEPLNVITDLGSPQVNIEGSDPGNVAALTDTRMIRVNKESSQQLPNGHSLNLWKNIDSKVKFGLSRGSSQYQQNLDRSPQSFDSSRNNCLDTGIYVANMEENTTVKDTSNDSFCSNMSHKTSTGGIMDYGWLDANNPRAVEQKSSVHGTKNLSHMQAIVQHDSQGMKDPDQGYFLQSNYTVHAAAESSETEKGCFPGIQVDEVPSRSSSSGSATDRSFGNFVPNKTTSISQNMLEHLQKVDQPREPGTEAHLSSSEHNQSSEMPDAETSDGSVGQFQHYRHSAAQSFGLQVGPPSQRFTIPDRPVLSQSSPQGLNSIKSVRMSPKVGRKGHALLGATASVQSSTHGASRGDIRNNIPSVSGHTNHKASPHNISGNVSAGFTSDYPYLESHLQSLLATDVGCG